VTSNGFTAPSVAIGFAKMTLSHSRSVLRNVRKIGKMSRVGLKMSESIDLYGDMYVMKEQLHNISRSLSNIVVLLREIDADLQWLKNLEYLRK